MVSTRIVESPWASLDEIADQVRACTGCGLSAERANAVPGEGSSAASILIIGEGPGAEEDKQGRPFVGRSGQLLDRLLASVPLAREDVFITNVVKCRPPGNRDPMPDEVAACMPYLQAQIALLDPRVIVTLGRHSLLRFDPEGRISRDHGRLIRWNNRILLPLYHPAAGLRNPNMMAALKEDIARLPQAVLEAISLRDAEDAEPARPAPSVAVATSSSQAPQNDTDSTAETERPGGAANRGDDQLSLF